jgi:hypothetical protein
MADTVTFAVQMTDYIGTPGETTRWLTAKQTWTKDRAEAVEITMARVPKAGQLQEIELRCQTFAGGFGKWLDLTMAADDLWAMLLASYVARIWPKERPPIESEADETAQWGQIEALWEADVDERAMALRAMRRSIRRIRFLAVWRVLVVAPPTGWEEVADLRDEPPGICDLLSAAYADAVAAAEATAGN